MTLTDGRLALTAAVRRSAGGSADVNAEIADVRARDSRVNGTMRVEWPDVGFLALLSPELEQVAGAVAVDLDVGGTVAEPTLDGRAAFSNGRDRHPALGPRRRRDRSDGDEQPRPLARDRRHGPRRRRRVDARRHDRARRGRGLAHGAHAARRHGPHRAAAGRRDLRVAGPARGRRAARHRSHGHACTFRARRSRSTCCRRKP